jgi:hypothetical protein
MKKQQSNGHSFVISQKNSKEYENADGESRQYDS